MEVIKIQDEYNVTDLGHYALELFKQNTPHQEIGGLLHRQIRLLGHYDKGDDRAGVVVYGQDDVRQVIEIERDET